MKHEHSTIIQLSVHLHLKVLSSHALELVDYGPTGVTNPLVPTCFHLGHLSQLWDYAATQPVHRITGSANQLHLALTVKPPVRRSANADRLPLSAAVCVEAMVTQPLHSPGCWGGMGFKRYQPVPGTKEGTVPPTAAMVMPRVSVYVIFSLSEGSLSLLRSNTIDNQILDEIRVFVQVASE